MGKDTEAQRQEGTCLRSHKAPGAEMGPERRSRTPVAEPFSYLSHPLLPTSHRLTVPWLTLTQESLGN